jgi:CHASE1-domain containing sensor protein
MSSAFILVAGLLLAGTIFLLSLGLFGLYGRVNHSRQQRQLENKALIKAMTALEAQNRDLVEKQKILLSNQQKLQQEILALRPPKLGESESTATGHMPPRILH